MFQSPHPSRLIDPALFGKLIADRRHIWQMDFLDVSAMADFSQKHGLSFFQKEDIIQLWQLGFLQADLIESSQKLQGIDLVERGLNEEEDYIYSDERQLHQHTQGWEGAISELKLLPPNMSLFFHPFRYYVLYQLEKMLSLAKSRVQVQFPIKSFAIPDFTFLQQRYNKGLLIREVETWNDIASLIIFTEPCVYERVFDFYVLREPFMGETGLEELQDQIIGHWEDVAGCYQRIPIDTLKEIHRDLYRAMRRVDRNENVHTILRLGSSKMRLEAEGHLGGAVLLQTMAEFLRRVTEEVFQEELPEEQNIDLSTDVKNQPFSSNRLLDGNRKVANEFLRQRGLDYNLRLRWYVEGASECAALRRHFEKVGANDIEVIDLHGQVYQNRVVSFRESLRSDKEKQLFSFVSIDEGEARNEMENVRAVRNAATRREMLGAFFLANPDFEFANFEITELEDVVWQLASSEEPSTDDRHKLHEQVKDATNSTQFFNGVHRMPQLVQVSKGKAWGEQLRDLAFEKRFKQGKKRPFIKAIDDAFYLIRTANLESYVSIEQNYRVDAVSGKLIKLKN